jgi:DNA mismatch endonuclease, patch repair protein
MADRLTKQHRSWNMSRIRGQNTAPELIVRSSLHKLGLRFRLHRRDLPGKPDIVLPRHSTAVLVHGCFWHRHAGCRFSYTPKSRIDFWQTKFASNVRRDVQVRQALADIGWRVVVIWECEVADGDKLALRLRRVFGLPPVSRRRRR